MRSHYRKLAFALANTAAVLVALYVAFSQNFERPYWAMFTVFILAKPISGVVRSKGVFRFLGTLAGVSMTLFLIPPLAQTPLLLCLAISGWVGFCLFVSLLDRTPRSYAFMLAGYTAAIVGFSVVSSPESVFDACVSRLEEISVGIVCGTLAHSVFFPQNVTKELWERVDHTVSAAATYIATVLAGASHGRDREATEQLAASVTGLHVLYTHIAFEISDVPRLAGTMRALQDRLAVLPAYLTSVEEVCEALVAQGALKPGLAAMLEEAADFARSLTRLDTFPGPPREHTIGIMAGEAIWPGLLEQALVINLNQLLRTLHATRGLADVLCRRPISLSKALQHETSLNFSRHLSRDTGLALLSGLAVIGAILLACTFWINASWPEGAVAAQFAAIGCSVFATLDRPTKLIGAAVTGILVALPVAAVYEFAIIPRIDGFPSLALVLSPVILLFSLMQTSEKLEGAALVLAVAFSGGLALQSSYKADFAAFVNSNCAEIAGLLIAAVTVMVMRTIDPVWNALRLSHAGWRSIIRFARSQEPDVPGWYAQMLDRIGLVAPRLKQASNQQSGIARIDPLRDLRVGLTLGELKVAYATSLGDGREILARVFEATGRFYRELFTKIVDSTQHSIPIEIDSGIAFFRSQPTTAVARDALASLTRLRLDLYPNAPPYRPVAPE